MSVPAPIALLAGGAGAFAGLIFAGLAARPAPVPATRIAIGASCGGQPCGLGFRTDGSLTALAAG